MKINPILLLIIVAILKSIFNYLLIKHSIENPNHLILSLAQFGAIIGVFLTLLYFILLSYLTYTISTLISMDFDTSFLKILNKWYLVGLTPMIICTLYFIFNHKELSENTEFIFIINTSSEIFFFIYGAYILYREIKLNIFYSLISIFSPIILFNLFKYVI
jgi:hypothetical protein